VAISELPVVRKADGQFLENLVRLGSKVVIDGTALPPEPHDQQMCPAHDDRSSKPGHLLGSPPPPASNRCWLLGQDPEWETLRATVSKSTQGALINARTFLTSVTHRNLNTVNTPSSGVTLRYKGFLPAHSVAEIGSL